MRLRRQAEEDAAVEARAKKRAAETLTRTWGGINPSLSERAGDEAEKKPKAEAGFGKGWRKRARGAFS